MIGPPPAVVTRSRPGEVGELRSLDPCESFVRFFLRKPSEGMGAAVDWGVRSDVLSTCSSYREESCAAVQRQWSSSRWSGDWRSE